MAFKHGLGIQVERPAAADPQNVWQSIFTIAGGLVLVTSLLGVRTVIQAGGASNMDFQHTIGGALCAAGAVTGNDVGTVYTITGTPGDAIVVGAVGAQVWLGMTIGLLATGTGGRGKLLGAGNVQVRMSAAAGTGSTRYVIWYIPLDAGATVVAIP